MHYSNLRWPMLHCNTVDKERLYETTAWYHPVISCWGGRATLHCITNSPSWTCTYGAYLYFSSITFLSHSLDFLLCNKSAFCDIVALSDVYWTVQPCNCWRIKDQLDVTFWVVPVLQAEACNTGTNQTQPHQISNTQRTDNKTTDVVTQRHSCKLLMMDRLMSKTCWVHKKWNKNSKWHQVGLSFFNPGKYTDLEK
jgi:hypothetical protein